MTASRSQHSLARRIEVCCSRMLSLSIEVVATQLDQHVEPTFHWPSIFTREAQHISCSQLHRRFGLNYGKDRPVALRAIIHQSAGSVALAIRRFIPSSASEIFAEPRSTAAGNAGARTRNHCSSLTPFRVTNITALDYGFRRIPSATQSHATVRHPNATNRVTQRLRRTERHDAKGAAEQWCRGRGGQARHTLRQLVVCHARGTLRGRISLLAGRPLLDISAGGRVATSACTTSV